MRMRSRVRHFEFLLTTMRMEGGSKQRDWEFPSYKVGGY